MRLALLNVDAITWSAAQSMLADGGCVLVWASEMGPWASEVQKRAPTARFDEPWESLLAGNVADRVLLGRRAGESEEFAAEQLGKLLRADVRLAVSYPPSLGVLAAYELEMVREELRGELRPLVPTLTAPGAAALIDQAQSGAAGAIEQVVFQRHVSVPTREAVLDALAGDLLLARRLVGELTRVAALAPPGEQVRYDQLGVQFSGPGGALVRWSAAYEPDAAGLHMTLIGTQGRLTFSSPAHGEPELQRIPRGGSEAPVALTPPESPREPSWLDAIRGLELVEAVERSLRRGKTIDLAVNEANETGTFKALMSAAGCLLLMAAPVILVAALAMARVPALQPLMRFVPVTLALLFVAFLGLQTLRWALPDEPKRGS